MAAENVGDIDPLHRQHVDLRNVASRVGEVLVNLGAVDDQSARPFQLAELGGQRGGLGLLGGDGRNDDQFAGLGLGRKRMLQRQGADLLGQLDRMAARLGTERATTRSICPRRSALWL
jgi:hypothetical protein